MSTLNRSIFVDFKSKLYRQILQNIICAKVAEYHMTSCLYVCPHFCLLIINSDLSACREVCSLYCSVELPLKPHLFVCYFCARLCPSSVTQVTSVP